MIKFHKDISSLVRSNFNKVARKYLCNQETGKSLQFGNAEVLLSSITKHISANKIAQPDTWLDMGCGTGTLLEAARQDAQYGWSFSARVRAAFDFSPTMVTLVKDRATAYTHVFELDAKELSSSVLMRETEEECVDMILANNVLHWLRDQYSIRMVLQRCRAVLKSGGALAASVAAEGTASQFIKVYRKTLYPILDRSLRRQWSAHLFNPIGLQNLYTLVSVARDSGFEVLEGTLLYEPKEYKTGTDEYMDAVESYALEVLMAPLSKLSEEEKRNTWQNVRQAFKEAYAGSNPHPPYVHDQYMIYLILKRLK